MIGRIVALEKASASEVNLLLGGAIIGCLNASVGRKVASVIDRGQSFTAVIEKAFPIYDDKFKPSGAHLDIRVEYLLEKCQPAIETENGWRCVASTEALHTNKRKGRTFFTKVAGVTFEGRQEIVARCSVGEHLILVRDPDNRFDPGAIKIIRLNGEELGFIRSEVCRTGESSGLASRMDRGDQYQCRISSLTGGGVKNLGVNIEITENEDFDNVPMSSAAPAHYNVGWLFAVVVLLIIVVFVIYIRS
ncbi:MAG TPA: HIRAN domain-containing protein [Bryobacteraceae bacterium]|nr:HIRAN domain-containing protein [Bryobacteraceae bacterium]